MNLVMVTVYKNARRESFVAQAIVSIGKQLALITIAEGVERKSQASQMLK